MTDEPRILTDDESARRRSEQAAGGPGRSIELCAEPGCPRAARWGPWCQDHRPHVERVVAAPDLTDTEIADLAAQVEADAAPLFVIAMSWIARQHIAHLDVDLDAIEASMHRIQAELAGETP